MSEQGETSGLSIFVLEDGRYVANALRRVLTRAGATVRGPFADDELALHHLKTSLPDCALVDINLGSGPSFETPKFLQTHGIPFVFISGLDEFAGPSEFAHIRLLRKPSAFPFSLARSSLDARFEKHALTRAARGASLGERFRLICCSRAPIRPTVRQRAAAIFGTALDVWWPCHRRMGLSHHLPPC